MTQRLGYFDSEIDTNVWGLTHYRRRQDLDRLDAWLFWHEGQLHLQAHPRYEVATLNLDFTAGRTAHRLRQLKQSKLPLARACGITKGHRPNIIDATSGLAQDSLLLAAAGVNVIMLEQHPLIYPLVADALARARAADLVWLNEIVSKVSHLQVNANDYLAHEKAEVVYLDPMYPSRDRGHQAKVKKGMQLLRHLSDCYTDVDTLFESALKSATDRVVVKRPDWAKPLADFPADALISMPKHHFDIYLTRHR